MVTNPLLLSDAQDKCATQLVRAFEEQGVFLALVPYHSLALTHRGITLNGTIIKPSFVLSRFMEQGTFEAITHKLSILHGLEEHGVAVFNRAATIERTVDKGLCSALLQKNAIATPAHITTQDEDQARSFVREQRLLGFDCILKPLFGARGQNMKRLDHETHLPPQEEVNQVWHLQRFIPTHEDSDYCRDWRVFVINNQAIATVERTNKGWCANVSMGGKAVSKKNNAIESLAIQAVKTCQAFYGGVDILLPLNATEDKAMVLEVNGIPAWRGVMNATKISIPHRLASVILKIQKNGSA